MMIQSLKNVDADYIVLVSFASLIKAVDISSGVGLKTIIY
jgi:hypothetical protein